MQPDALAPSTASKKNRSGKQKKFDVSAFIRLNAVVPETRTRVFFTYSWWMSVRGDKVKNTKDAPLVSLAGVCQRLG
jgi:hypothetical protein